MTKESRIKAIDWARANAKKELELIVLGADRRTAELGLEWTLGKLAQNCPHVVVSVKDLASGSLVSHPVPIALPASCMAHEINLVEWAILAERKKTASR